MSHPIRTAACLIALGLWSGATPHSALAQSAAPVQAARPNEALRIFLDCPNFVCDLDFFRVEITFVNYVRDRTDAEVHVLGTVEPTNGGGRRFTFDFMGQRAFAGRNDRLRYVSQPNDPDDAVRHGLAQTVRLGLVRYIAETSFADQLEIAGRARAQVEQALSRSLLDPWNLWVMRAGLTGSFNGERSDTASNINGSFTANRTTEEWRIDLGVNGSDRSRRVLLDDSTFRSVSRSLGARGLVVRSLNDHWSAALDASATSSTFLNQELALHAGPGIEYNVFPYAQSTRRQLTFQYVAGVTAFRYHDETIFGKRSETLRGGTLLVSLDTRQPWGSSDISFEAAHYFQDLRKNHLLVFGDASIKIFRGFSLTMNASASRIHDQIYLRKGEDTAEEILTHQRQLLTSYQYFVAIGFSYTFGSIYNNVVNPRFNGSSGG